MLVRNMSKIVLKARNKGVTLAIPVGEAVEVDENIFSQKFIKNLWGNFVRITAEVNDELPTQPQDDLEDKEDKNLIPADDAANNKEDNGDETEGDENSADNTSTEDNADDDNDIDNLVDEVLEVIENEAGEDKGNAEAKEAVEAKPAKPAKAKATKATKSSKKKATK